MKTGGVAVRGNCPKTKNPDLKVEDVADDMELCESKADLSGDYHADLK